QPPFDPSETYPELSRLTPNLSPSPNAVYGAVRQSLAALGLDVKHYQKPEWNPFGSLLKPGNRVLIKPNWVVQGHHDNDSWEQIITHGSVIRAVSDYVALALRGVGRVTIADGPMLQADFSKISDRVGILQLIDHYRKTCPEIAFEVIDLRHLRFETK